MTEKWNGCVAVVDDERDVVDLIVRVLYLNNIPICFKTYDGDEALRKFQKCDPKPRAIIIDYRMPSITGIEAMEKIHKTHEDVKFIFLSADSEVKNEALRAGASMFLVKPVSMKELLIAVEQVVGI